jgi:hypothetical protein
MTNEKLFSGFLKKQRVKHPKKRVFGVNCLASLVSVTGCYTPMKNSIKNNKKTQVFKE